MKSENKICESDKNVKTTCEKGGREPPHVTLDDIFNDLLSYIGKSPHLNKTYKNIEKKYDIKKESDGRWPEDDIKRAWGKTQRMDDTSLKNKRWSLAILLQVIKRKRNEAQPDQSNEKEHEQKKGEGSNKPNSQSVYIRIPISVMFKNESTSQGGEGGGEINNPTYKLIDRFPLLPEIKKKQSYVMMYNNQTRNAAWVYEILNRETVPLQNKDEDRDEEKDEDEEKSKNKEKNKDKDEEKKKIKEKNKDKDEEKKKKKEKEKKKDKEIKKDKYEEKKKNKDKNKDKDEHKNEDEEKNKDEENDDTTAPHNKAAKNTAVTPLRNKSNVKFREDTFDPLYEAIKKIEDCNESDYEQGHLASAANHKWCTEAYEDTFCLSNIAPQVPAFNQGLWKKLEDHCQKKIDNQNDIRNVHVYSGPLYLLSDKKKGKLLKIWKSKVVPTHFFKVIIVEHINGKVELECYKMPNENPADENSQSKDKNSQSKDKNRQSKDETDQDSDELGIYEVSIKEIETDSGLRFTESSCTEGEIDSIRKVKWENAEKSRSAKIKVTISTPLTDHNDFVYI